MSEQDLAARLRADRSSAGPALLCLGSAVFWLILGSFAGRISSIKMHLPDWLVGIDQRGARRALVDPTDHRVMIVDFVYTRCTSICSVLGSSYQQLQSQIEKRHMDGQVRLVTVSFDPDHDSLAVIADYGERLRAHPDVWTIMRPIDAEELRSSLKAFGIVATPSGNGQFVHNAAFHVIDRRGRLARIVDIDQPQRAIAAVRQLYDDAS